MAVLGFFDHLDEGDLPSAHLDALVGYLPIVTAKLMQEAGRRAARAELAEAASTAGVEDANACGPCVVCLSQRRDVVFLTCGHLVVCRHCATSCKTCPICRAPVEGSLQRVYTP